MAVQPCPSRCRASPSRATGSMRKTLTRRWVLPAAPFGLTPPPPSLTTVPRAQVLMGLNFSQLTCHFTSTANLTACQSPATQWHAYTRDAEASTAAALFDVSAGFLGAGDDARAPAELSVAGCEATCAGLASCRGFTFQVDSARAGVSSALIAHPRSLGAWPTRPTLLCQDTLLTCACPPLHSRPAARGRPARSSATSRPLSASRPRRCGSSVVPVVVVVVLAVGGVVW